MNLRILTTTKKKFTIRKRIMYNERKNKKNYMKMSLVKLVTPQSFHIKSNFRIYVFQCRRRQQQKIYLCTQNIGNAMYCFHSSKFEMHALQR